MVGVVSFSQCDEKKNFLDFSTFFKDETIYSKQTNYGKETIQGTE